MLTDTPTGREHDAFIAHIESFNSILTWCEAASLACKVPDWDPRDALLKRMTVNAATVPSPFPITCESRNV